ncbi:MAG TPA: MCE family protein [Mycobacteriales bacterium]|jgi:phospholipid/cholesterol/gamma-HCH transport system substrate-binding protein|nr:MCE family protein [Mycobacteriales bacterium]
MRQLRARNPLALGVVGTALLVAALLAVVILPRVPAFSADRSYSANFAQAAGLASGDEVRVAGIPEGTVTGVHLDRDVIRVDFTLPKTVHIGSETTASIEVATLLGTKYVELTPAGAGALSTSVPIPVSRTKVPFDLADVTNGLSSTVGGLDIPTLRAALRTVSATFAHTPDATRGLLRGIAGISKVLVSRQSQLRDLLVSSRDVTATLASQRHTLDALFTDADAVLATLHQRRAIIHSLLQDASRLGTELDHLISHNRATLGPLIERLHVVTTLLRKDDHVLARAIDLLAPASRGLTNATGDGPYIDINLPYLLLPDNVLCGFSIATGCR